MRLSSKQVARCKCSSILSHLVSAAAATIHRFGLRRSPLPTPLAAAVGRLRLRLFRPPPLAGSAYLQSSSIAAPLIQEGYANAMITYFNMNDSSTIGAAYIQGAFIPYINMKDSSSTISYFDDMTSN